MLDRFPQISDQIALEHGLHFPAGFFKVAIAVALDADLLDQFHLNIFPPHFIPRLDILLELLELVFLEELSLTVYLFAFYLPIPTHPQLQLNISRTILYLPSSPISVVNDLCYTYHHHQPISRVCELPTYSHKTKRNH